MVLDTSLLNTQRYKVRIKCKVEQSRVRCSALSYTSMSSLSKKEPSIHPRLRSPTTIYIYIYICLCFCVSVQVNSLSLTLCFNELICLHTVQWFYIYLISKLGVIDGDPKASFSIASTQRCKRGRSFFSWIAPLTLSPYPIMLSVKQGGIK